MVVGLFFTMVEQTVGLFITLPRGPGWRRIDSPLRVGEWSAWLTGWITGWHVFLVVVLFLSNRTTDWRSPPTSIRASLFNAPSIDLALTRHQGDLSGCPWTSIKMTSRWDARYLGVVLVSVRYTRLDARATSACTTCRRIMWRHQEWLGNVSLSHDNARSVHINRQTERIHRRRTDIHTVIIPRANRRQTGNKNTRSRIEFQIELHGQRRYVGQCRISM